MRVGFAAIRGSWRGGERAEEGPGGIPVPSAELPGQRGRLPAATELGLRKEHCGAHIWGQGCTSGAGAASQARASGARFMSPGSGVAPRVRTSGAGTAPRASTSGPRQHTWSRGGTSGAGTAHLEPARRIWPRYDVLLPSTPPASEPSRAAGSRIAQTISLFWCQLNSCLLISSCAAAASCGSVPRCCQPLGRWGAE